MIESILITGGSGFLGSHIFQHLQSKGFKVSTLGRKVNNSGSSYLWDIENKKMDPASLSDIGTIIHLAGAGIADKRWTNSYKKEIIDSRIKSTALLYDTLKSVPNSVHTVISASAIGYYGDTGDDWVEEDFHAPEDFLGETCREWEKASERFKELGIRVVIFRIGLVLDKSRGVLPAISLPVKLFVGAPLGTGKQYMSWIHREDLCRMFSFAVDEKKMQGVYNAVAPKPVTNDSFIKLTGKIIHRPIWPFNVPSFILKLILGEKAVIVLNGQRVSSEKIRMAGFNFIHTDLEKTLTLLL